MRYGWGLKLFKDDFDIPIERARRQANICVDDLRRANLLIKSDQDGCIKMHDLARGYVLSNISKFKQASIVNPGDHSQWPTHDSRECLERTLLKCTDMSEFPKVFNYPNLTLLILRNGEKILKFPEDFYERMKKLEVISYDEMHVSLLHRSLQCSTNLRSLCFHGCNLMIDFSFIGDLLNLEVLSFAHCSIQELPSAIGKLTKLKLLDLTGCVNLRIDGRVFRNLEYLKELYARGIRFSDFNCNELKMHITKLLALEVELYHPNFPENVSFAKLERFRISMDCSLEAFRYEIKKYSFKNRLRLKVQRNTLLEYKINELFEKTEELYFEVNGVIHLLDFSMHTSQHSFCNLRNLEVYGCSDLTYLFTVQVASGLIKLESLTISECPLLKTLVLGESENNGGGVIEFPKLKFLCLGNLPQLVSLCDSDNEVELPQLVDLEFKDLGNFTSIYPDNVMKPFFNKEVKVPKLEKLRLYSMEKLKQIWPCKITEEEVNIISMLKEIRVKRCDSLVNLFTSNRFPLLNHLEELYIEHCACIKYLFSPLMVKLLTNLKEVIIWSCDGIEEVVSNRDDHENEKMDTSHTNTTFFLHLDTLSLYKLKNLKRIGGGTSSVIHDELKFSQVGDVSWSLCEYSKNIRIEECNALSSVIPSYAIGKMDKLQELTIYNCTSMIEVFETNEIKNNNNNNSGGSSAILAIPRLGNIMMLKLPNLKIVKIESCDLLEHIFPFSSLDTLGQLEVLEIKSCKAMKEIVKEESGEKTKIPNDVVFPCLKSIKLINLPNLVGFFLGMNVFRWPVLDDVTISDCPQMTVFTSGRSITSKLKYIHTRLGKHSLECGVNFHVTSTLHQTSSWCPSTLERLPWSFLNLIELYLFVYWSDSKIIPSSELLQLKKLEKIQLLSVNVKEVFELAPEGTNSGSNDSKSVVKLPNLREMELSWNRGLKYIWKSNEWTVLEFPNLTTLSISSCNQLEHVFTSSMVGSLLQLQHLEITHCSGIEVIVKEEAWDAEVKEVVLPCLKSLTLENLKKLKGFCLGKDDFSWPSLNSLILNKCPAMEVFTMGHLATPELKEIDTDFRNSCDVREDLNSFIKKKHQERVSYSGEDEEEQSTF